MDKRTLNIPSFLLSLQVFYSLQSKRSKACPVILLLLHLAFYCSRDLIVLFNELQGYSTSAHKQETCFGSGFAFSFQRFLCEFNPSWKSSPNCHQATAAKAKVQFPHLFLTLLYQFPLAIKLYQSSSVWIDCVLTWQSEEIGCWNK